MGNYEDENTQSLEVFSSFVEKTKAAMQALIENIKENIKNFEIEISNTTRAARSNEDSIKKCENEIARKTDEIEIIKGSIENVQSTFKKIVDAYSSTSRGETKDLYSEVIENARKNCEEETDKYQEEIVTLTSDIDAINGNIKEFTQTGKDLEELIEQYTQELEKYKKALSFVNETVGKYNNRLDNINNNIIQTKREKGKPLNFGYTYYRPSELNSTVEHYNINSNESLGEKFEEPALESTINFEDSLKQIYDLTGYTPPKEEPKEEEIEVKQEEEKEVEVNEDALKAEEFQIDTEETPEEEVKEDKKEAEKEEKIEEAIGEETEEEPKEEETTEEETDSLSSDEIDEWEKILNSADDMLTNLNKASDEEPKAEVKEEPKEEAKEELVAPEAPETPEAPEAPIIPEVPVAPEEPAAEEKPEDLIVPAPEEEKVEEEAAKVAEEITSKEDDINKETLEQLLKPYGTTYDNLSEKVSKEYTLKDGTKVPFELTLEDVIKAINAVDGNDLKLMKQVGPEITILKKVKAMKEGNK